ncbi:MAG: hypothetical protein ACQEXJ_23250 [Myxococcota bacterium]
MSIPRTLTNPVAAAAAALAVLLATPALAHSPLDGRLRVDNDRHTPVRITVDEDLSLRVPARSSRTLKRVPNGVRVVRIAGRGGTPVVEHVTVPVKGRARLQVAPRHGAAVLRNRSGVAMAVTVDGERVGRVADGERLRIRRLAPGPHRLVATPTAAWARGGTPLEQTFRVRPGERARVKLRPWVASLRVHSPFPGRVALFVDGVRRADLHHRDRAAVVRRLTPGRHRVSLRGHGRILAEATVRVAPGERETWRPARHHGKPRPAHEGHGPPAHQTSWFNPGPGW